VGALCLILNFEYIIMFKEQSFEKLKKTEELTPRIEDVESLVEKYGPPPYVCTDREGRIVFRTSDIQEFSEYLKKIRKEDIRGN